MASFSSNKTEGWVGSELGRVGADGKGMVESGRIDDVVKGMDNDYDDLMKFCWEQFTMEEVEKKYG